MAKLDFRHEICTPDNESTFEAFRNEDPFSYSFDIRITTVHEKVSVNHLSVNQMNDKYRRWIKENKCVLNVYERELVDSVK